jgi:uncharacterized membrane protein YdfJ with MMPL/SSD domain
VARGTAGAPRKDQAPRPRAQAPLATQAPPVTQAPPATQTKPVTQALPVTGTRGRRLIGFVTGRRTKYLVIVFWLLLVAVTGSLAGKGINPTLLYATLAAVIVLLLLIHRSPVLWLLPVVAAGMALTVAEAVIYLLAQHANLTVNGQSEDILVVLVIGASTDYALLLIARYREELRWHADRHVAVAVALRRAGPAIVASCLTVVAGMLCLLAVESNDISGLVPVAAVGIAAGLIAAVTLLPALLVMCGRWTFWPAGPGLGTAEPTGSGPWSRMGARLGSRAGRSIARRPRTVWITALVLLGAGAVGLAGFHVGPLPLDIGRHIWWPSSLALPRPDDLTGAHAA